jgi:hypothetical protein
MAQHVGFISEVKHKDTFPGNVKDREINRRIVTTNTDRPDLSLPTARLDTPVPYIVGRVRVVQPNFIWYGNIQNIIEETVETTTETVKTKGIDY